MASPAFAGRTQIIVQWTHQIDWFRVQATLDNRAQRLGYDSDGNDIGSGTVNFYLYSPDENVDGVVRDLVAMEKQQQLPPGMQIGVAIYKDTARKDWAYRAAYPTGLKNFDIMYRKN